MFLTLAFATLAASQATPPATALAYRADGKLLAVGTRGEVLLIDPATGEAVGELPGQTGRVTALTFSKDGTLAVASGKPGKSGIVRLYSLADTAKLPDKPAAEFTAHKDAVYALTFSPDGSTLATAGYDRLIKLWDAKSPSAPKHTLTDHSDAVYAVAFSPDGKLLASASADRAVKVWDAATGKRLYTLGDPTDWVYAVAWHPAGGRLAAAGADKSIRVWEVNTDGGRLLRSAFAHEKAVTRLLFSSDGKALHSVGEDRTVKVWNPDTLTETRVFPAQPDAVLAAALRPDGKQLAVGRYDGVVQLLDAATGNATATPVPVKPKPPAVAKLSRDHAARGGTVRIAVEGNRLDTADGAKVSAGGVTVKVLPETRTRGRLELELAVGDRAAVGPTNLTVIGPGGESAPVPFWIDRFPLAVESGTTDSASTGMTVSLPATIAGALDRTGDADFYRFRAEAGQQIGVQLTTDAKGFDPVLTLTDETGQTIAEGKGGLLGTVCPAAGTYAVGVRDREYRGGSAMPYRLHVGPVPVITGVFPLAVERGRETAVRVSGVNLGRSHEMDVAVHPPADAKVGSKLTVPIPRDGGDPVGPAEVVVGEFPAVTVHRGEVAALPVVPGTADGILGEPGESHTVRFEAKRGQRLIVEVEAARLGSPVDPFVEVLDADGKPVPRAVLRCLAKTAMNLRDRSSSDPGLRLEAWNELAMRDYLYADGELMRIDELPKNPDDDCLFVQAEGKRIGFLDTTPKYHAFGTALYKVEVHPPGTAFPPNGMPLFPLFYRNDDGGPGYGKDSRVFFDPPADGTYRVRVSDAAGAGGPGYAYRLTVRPPRPDFAVKFAPTAPKVWKGGAIPVAVTATRIDGFDGPISVSLEGLKPPFRAPATAIEAGQFTTSFALSAGDEPVSEVMPLRLVARATIDGREVVREEAGGKPTVADKPDIVTATSVNELAIRPGREARMVVAIDRRNGFKGRVPVEVRGLPYGVRVMNIGLNGILVLPNATEREIVIYAEPWVEPTARPFVVLAKRESNGTEFAAPAVVLKVKE